jgi:hypothetical protein
MVCLDAEKIEAFLYGDADSASATPQANEKVGLEASLRNHGGELEGVFEEIVRGDEFFSHWLFRACGAVESGQAL